jgi:hypothetical protein
MFYLSKRITWTSLRVRKAVKTESAWFQQRLHMCLSLFNPSKQPQINRKTATKIQHLGHTRFKNRPKTTYLLTNYVQNYSNQALA